MRAALDHLVFGTASLEQGAVWLRERLGAELQPGGKHSLMGTHNRLLRLGERSYLELIAIDPEAEKPGRPRWFNLDRFEGEDGEVLLLTWVAAVPSLSQCRNNFGAGEVLAMSRGALSWHITVPVGGVMPENGVLPALIEWPANVHPASALPHSSVQLEWLELGARLPEKLMGALQPIGFDLQDRAIRVVRHDAGPRLRALLRTPSGPVCFETGVKPSG